MHLMQLLLHQSCAQYNADPTVKWGHSMTTSERLAEFKDRTPRYDWGLLRNETQPSVNDISPNSSGTKEPNVSIDRKAGDGSNTATEDYGDGRLYSSFESGARTSFNPQEAGNNSSLSESHWHGLLRWQRGTRSNWNDHKMDNHISEIERQEAEFKRRTAAALCDSCGVNRAERRLVVEQSTELDYHAFGAHSDIYRGLLGLIAAVAEVRRPTFGANFKRAALHRQDAFRELMDETGLDYRGLETIKREVHNQLDWLEDLREMPSGSDTATPA